MNEMVPTEQLAKQAPPAPAADQNTGRGGRGIAIAVNLLGVLLVAGLAFYFGTALYEGVTAKAVALVGIGAVVVALIVAPDAGLLLWMALAPFGQLFNLTMGRGLPDLSLSRIAAATMLVLLFAQVATGKRRLVRPTAVEAWGLAFAAAMLLSVATSRLGWVTGIQHVVDLVAMPLLCYFFAANLLRKPRHMHWVAVTLAIIVAVLGFIAAREQLTNQAILSPLPYRWEYGQHSVKVTSLFGAPAIMAFTLALPLPFLLVGAMRSRDLGPRLLWFAAIAAAATGALLTYVRAGWLAVVLGLVTVALLSTRTRGSGVRLLLVLVGLLIALVFALGLVNLQAIQERAQSEQPITYRTSAISVGLTIARRSPVIGMGLDNFSDDAVAAGWRPLNAAGLPAVAPHNLFIYVLTSAGLLGLIPLLGLFATLGLRLIRSIRRMDLAGGSDPRRDWFVAGLAMLLGYLLMANTFDAIGAGVANMLFFMTLGAVFAAPAVTAQAAPVPSVEAG